MEVLFEILLSIIVEGSIEISSNKRLSKWVRYPLIILLGLFFASVILCVLFVGISSLEQNIFVGLLLIFIGLIMLFGCIYKFMRKYIGTW